MNRLIAAALAALLFAWSLVANAQEKSPLASLPWEFGPTTGHIGDTATIKVPKGYAFLGPEGTRQLNKLMENPDSGGTSYTLVPEDMRWMSFFSFNKTGYIKDDEEIKPDELFESVRAGTEAANEERRKNGWDLLHLTGWAFKPQYDRQLKTLEWAFVAKSERSAEEVVNYNTRLLGRRGVTEVVVVDSPATLNASVGQFKSLLDGFAYTSGESYAEYRPGDHVAEYGLAALVAGGAAAVASKKGFFAVIGIALLKMWKLALLAVALAGGWLKSLLRRKSADPAQ